MFCMPCCVACSGANELDIGGNNDLDVCLELAEVGDSKEERGERWRQGVAESGSLCLDTAVCGRMWLLQACAACAEKWPWW